MTRTISILSALLATTLGGGAVLADNSPEPASLLAGRIDYRFVGHQEDTDDEGRLLVWVAEAGGELPGTMKWWFDMPPPVSEVAVTNGRVTYYSARWELWNNGVLVLAGVSTGKTVFADDGDGIWDGHGIVTETGEGHEALLGRRIYETGPVLTGPEPPVSFSGTGLFAVY